MKSVRNYLNYPAIVWEILRRYGHDEFQMCRYGLRSCEGTENYPLKTLRISIDVYINDAVKCSSSLSLDAFHLLPSLPVTVNDKPRLAVGLYKTS